MKSISQTLRELMMHPKARGLDLDSAEATEVHTALIREDPFRRKLYDRFYDEMSAVHQRSPAGLFVEIGSGGGFIKDRIPEAATIDLRPKADVDLTASALQLPFQNKSISTIGMLNVLHHLPKPRDFFSEVSRVLVPGGRMVLIEPYASALSKVIYQNLHHEPFEPLASHWELPEGGPMSSANGAMPWCIFVRDRQQFETEFPGLTIERVSPHTVYMYIVSGGVSMRTLAPSVFFKPLATLENGLKPLYKSLASMMTVEISSAP